jgi:glucodextranase-like protein
MTRRAAILATLVLVMLAGCSPSGAITQEGDATPPPVSADELVITSPEDGATVSDGIVTVTGTAPDGADVVRDARFGRDDHTTATGGQWSMQVELDEGDNLLTFRVGDAATTSATLAITFAPGGVGVVESPAAEQTPEAEDTPVPESTPEATADPEPKPLSVKVTKRTSSVPRNATASVTIKTTKGARCTIDVVYNSGSSQAAGLGPKKANSSGSITWKWKVGGNTAKGTYPIYVSCEKGDREGSADTTFRVR